MIEGESRISSQKTTGAYLKDAMGNSINVLPVRLGLMDRRIKRMKNDLGEGTPEYATALAEELADVKQRTNSIKTNFIDKLRWLIEKELIVTDGVTYEVFEQIKQKAQATDWHNREEFEKLYSFCCKVVRWRNE